MGFNIGGSLQLNTIRSESQIAKKIDSWYVFGNANIYDITTNTAGDGVNIFSRAVLSTYFDGDVVDSVYVVYIYGKDKLADDYITLCSSSAIHENQLYTFNMSFMPKRFVYCAVLPQYPHRFYSGYLKGLILP